MIYTLQNKYDINIHVDVKDIYTALNIFQDIPEYVDNNMVHCMVDELYRASDNCEDIIDYDDNYYMICSSEKREPCFKNSSVFEFVLNRLNRLTPGFKYMKQEKVLKIQKEYVRLDTLRIIKQNLLGNLKK